MLQNIKKTIYILIAALICNQTIAQVGDTLEIQRTKEGNIRFVRFAPSNTRKIKNSVSFLKLGLNTNIDENFTETSNAVDDFGAIHKKFQQHYKGIKVEGGVYSTHGKNGTIEVMNGNYKHVNIGSVTPSINEAVAIGNALKIINAITYKWQDTSMESFIKIQKQDFNATYYPNGELVIINDPTNDSFKLAWKLVISCSIPDDEIQIYIDAQTGKKIASRSLIENTNFYPASFNTQYSSVQKATVDQTSASNFRLREVRSTTNSNTVNVNTLNLQHGTTNFSTAFDFTNTKSTFDAANWTSFNQDRAALDAHWGTENVLDFWSTVFKRNSLNGTGLTINNYIHYSSGLNNAGWDNTNLRMVFGDGDGVTFNGFATLDVMAHEMGHGVNHFTANLGGSSNGFAEEDALNEGLSDIWAICVKQQTNQTLGLNKTLWLLGNEIIIPSSGLSCVRNIQNPKSTTASEGQHPDTYHGTYWSSIGEPHYNSTVLSHWFFLLSQGGSGTNDLGNIYNVNGISIAKAEQIVYQAESYYIHSGALYTDARNAMIQAARDLNGMGSCEEIAVTNAWYAVGVGAAYSWNLTGNGVVCSGSSQYTINSSGAIVIWSITGNPNVVNLTQNNNIAVLTQVGVGTVILTATVNYSCFSSPIILTKTISVGAPISSGEAIGSISNLTNTGGTSFRILSSTGSFAYQGSISITDANRVATSYKWGFPSYSTTTNGIFWTDLGSGGLSLSSKINNGNATFRCTMSNSCGSAYQDYYFTTSNLVMMAAVAAPVQFSVSPNPASSNITIKAQSATSPSIGTTTGTSFSTVQIVDKMGVLKKIFNYPSGTSNAILDISSLPTDVYVARIFDGTNWESHSVIISR